MVEVGRGQIPQMGMVTATKNIISRALSLGIGQRFNANAVLSFIFSDWLDADYAKPILDFDLELIGADFTDLPQVHSTIQKFYENNPTTSRNQLMVTEVFAVTFSGIANQDFPYLILSPTFWFDKKVKSISLNTIPFIFSITLSSYSFKLTANTLGPDWCMVTDSPSV